MPAHESVSLTAAEHLKFQAMVDYCTYADPRRGLSDALLRVSSPQGWFVCDAWQRVARRMWR